MKYPPCLVLAKNYSPASIFPKLSILPGEEAIQKYLKEKADVIDFYDRPVLSKGKPIEYGDKGVLFWPSIIVDYETKIRDSIRMSTSVLYYREHGKCFYCHQKMSTPKSGTKDHVMPISRGGDKHAFENLVFACYECNNEKADSLPVGKWKPAYQPKTPTYHDILAIYREHEIKIYHEGWLQFLPGFANYRLIELKETES